VWKSKLYGAFVLNLRVDLHAIDATPARWRGGRRSEKLPHRLYHVAPRQLSILDAMAKPPSIDAKQVNAVLATSISSGSPSVK
jgi:hypothetical protein